VLFRSGISGGGGGGGLKNNMGLIAISLPGFKSIDLLQQTNLTNSFMNEIDDYLLNEEKENTPENLNNTDAAKKDDANNKTPLLSTSKSKEFLNEASCSSVPVALLVSSNKASPSFAVSNATISLQKTPIMEKTSLSAKKSAQTKKNESLTDKSSNLEGNFCFSGASGISSSTSKLNSNLMKTPDASSLGVRSSPRSLKNNNSKRKLDLNVFQIDQMPDKDFVEINEKCPKDSIVSMEDLNQVENKKSLFKKPLTEHQKEVRKKKSFIPMEIQSVCSVLEPTMDSQMSCTNDTFAADDSIVNSQFAKPAMNETSNALIQFSLNSLGKPAEPPAQQEMECEHSEETKLVHKDDEDYLIANTDMLVTNEATLVAAANPLPLQSIKFQSKMNPNKKIDLVEVKNETIPAVTVIEKPAVEVAAVEPSVEEEKTISQEAVTDPNETEEKLSQIDSSQRRRSARLKSKEVPTSTPGNDEPVEPISLSQISSSSANTSTGSMEFTVTNVGENITELASQLETKLETPVINSEEILEKLNEECKLMKTIKMKIKSNKTRLKAGGGQPGVTKLLKINHQLGQGKIVKKTFKSYQQKLNFAKKQKKYRKLIKGIKQSTNKAEKKLKKIEKKALVNNLNSLLVEETHVAEVSLKENAVEVKQHDIYEFVDNEVKKEVTIADDDDEDDDDEKPLMALIKKETPKVAEAVVEPIEAVKLLEEPVKTIQMEVEAPKPHKKLTDIIEGESSPPSTPTAPSKRDLANTLLAEALGTSPSTAALIQKLNDTPTTSILKKKLTESKVSHSAVKHLTYGNGDSGTPNKRRVSFCEAVQIEEIEPNANKSLFNRSTPKPRAKLVLTSYFNNKQITSPAMVGNSISTIHAHSSSSTTMSAVTVISNAQTYESKLNCSLNSAMNNMSPKLPSSLNSLASQFKLNANRMSTSEALSSSNTTPNSINANAQMSPSSSSLINFFSNNKQNLLSQRSTIIQQQMVQHQQQRTSQQSIKSDLITNLSQQIPVTSTHSSLKPVVSAKTGQIDEESTPAESIIRPLYTKLNNCMIEMEKIVGETAFQDWLLNDPLPSFKSNKIFTLSDLCSFNSADINNLPFRQPKLESFFSFIKKFEELNKPVEVCNEESNKQISESSEVDLKQADVSKTEMDIDLELVEHKTPINKTEVFDEEKKVPTKEFYDNAALNLNNFVSNTVKTELQIDALNMAQTIQLLEQTESMETALLSQLGRLTEARKKLRIHCEGLLNASNI